MYVMKAVVFLVCQDELWIKLIYLHGSQIFCYEDFQNVESESSLDPVVSEFGMIHRPYV